MNFLKLTLAFIIGLSLSLAAGSLLPDRDLAVGGGTGTLNQLSQFFVSGGNVQLASTTANFRIPSLTNEDCIGTDANGVLQSGTCTGGTGGAATSTLEIDGVAQGDIEVLDFADADFAITESPAGDFDITIDSTIARDTELHSAVTLAGTPDYITLSGQQITRGTIDIGDDTNLTAGDALTLTGDDIDFDGGTAPAGELGGSWASPTIDDNLAVTSWNLTSPTLTSFFGTPCTGNQFLQDIADSGAFTCATASGGGGDSLWATSTNNDYIYPVDLTQTVLIGTTSTSSPAFLSAFEVDGSSYFVHTSDASPVLTVERPDGNDGTGLLIDINDTGTGAGLVIDTEATGGNALTVNSAVTGSNNIYFGFETTRSSNNRGLLIQDLSSGNAQTTMELQNSGTGNSLVIDTNFIVDTNGALNLAVATSTGKLAVNNQFYFDGINGTAWPDFCVEITGSADLCDGVDATGSGGAGLATSTAVADTYVIYGTSASTVGAESAFTYDDANNLLTVGTTGEYNNKILLQGASDDYPTFELKSGTNIFRTFVNGVGDDIAAIGTFSPDDMILYASSTNSMRITGDGHVQLPRNSLQFPNGGSSGSNYTLYQTGDDFLSVKRDGGSDTNYSIFMLEAPDANPTESTMTLMRNYGSGNQEYVDLFNQRYVGAEALTGVVVGKSGTGALLPYTLRFFNRDLGNITANATYGFTAMPDGKFGIAVGTTTLAAANASLYVASTTAPAVFKGSVTVDGDLIVADEAYAVGWNASTEVPTKNAVYDIIETLGRIAGQVWTGVHDFGSAVLEIPNGTNPTANDVGELAHDTSDNQLILDDFVIAKATERIWSVTVASTSPYMINGTNLPVPTELDGYVMTRLSCHTVGGTSVAIIVTDGTNATESVTCDSDGATDDGSITNATVTAGEFMYLDFGTVTGAVNTVSVTVSGQWVRE